MNMLQIVTNFLGHVHLSMVLFCSINQYNCIFCNMLKKIIQQHFILIQLMS